MPQASTGRGSSSCRSWTSTETRKTSLLPLGEDEDEEDKEELRRRTTLTRMMRPSLSRRTCLTAPNSVLEGSGELLVDRLVDAAAAFVLAGEVEEAAAMTMVEERRREEMADEIAVALGLTTISGRGNRRCCCVPRQTAYPLAEAPVTEARMTRRENGRESVWFPPEKEEKK